MNKQNKQANKNSGEQYLVNIHGKKEWAQMLNYLIDIQYENPQNFILKVFPKKPTVICVDRAKKVFFGLNVTCLACAVSSGKKVIGFNELRSYLAY